MNILNNVDSANRFPSSGRLAKTIMEVNGASSRRSHIARQERGQTGLRVLVILAVLAIPFENEYSLWGFSIAKLAIIPLLLTVVLLQPKRLLAVLKHRVLIAALAFVAWGALSESFRSIADWLFIYRVLQTLVFAALVGAVATNLLAYRRIMRAIALVCSALALYLILAFYGAVSVDVAGFKEAGRVRAQSLGNISLDTGLNILAYTVGMGAVVALAQFLGNDGIRRRLLWGTAYVLCAVGSFIPLSRGSFVALLGASIVVVLRSRRGLMTPGRMALLIGVVIVAFSFTPRALTERYYSLDPDAQTGAGRNAEGRIDLLNSAFGSLSDFWDVGIGSGYYWQRWGPQKGFGTLGPHNAFLTAWIFYGLPGLFLLGLTCFFAARDCPKPSRRWRAPAESAALTGLLVLALFWLAFTHNLYLKSFGVILGLLIGASLRQEQESRRSIAKATPIRARPFAVRNSAMQNAQQFQGAQIFKLRGRTLGRWHR